MALVTILAREMRLKTFRSRPTFGNVASGASHDIGAGNAIEIFSNRRSLKLRLKFYRRPSFGDVASAASHHIGARNAIERFLKSTKLWTCCEWR